MQAVILAAGKGKRMRSSLPKVLHPLLGVPLVLHTLRAARAAGVDRVVVVVGHGAEEVVRVVNSDPSSLPRGSVTFVTQAEQRGTGHALLCALPELAGPGPVLVLSGDVPLLRPDSLSRLLAASAHASAGLALLVSRPASPTGYGRVLRDGDGHIVAIREERDATDAERRVAECNAGVYCIDAAALHAELPALQAHNAQGELYLTDLVERLAGRGEIGAVEVDAGEVAGVNTPEQLAELEALARARA